MRARTAFAWFLLGLGSLTLSAEALAEPLPRVLYADRDDDDADGRVDGKSPYLLGPVTNDLVWLDGPPLASHAWIELESDAARLISSRGQILKASQRVRQLADKPVRVQGLHAGEGKWITPRAVIPFAVLEWMAVDSDGQVVSQSRSHASLSRMLPMSLANASPTTAGLDEDALSWLVAGPVWALPETTTLRSRGPDGALLDELSTVELSDATCPKGLRVTNVACRTTIPIRATVDAVDRSHPEALGHSIQAEVGGQIEVGDGAKKVASLRVGGPRRWLAAAQTNQPWNTLAAAASGRFRARVNVYILRGRVGGRPAVGANDDQALSLARSQLRAASKIWGQCGVHFGYGAAVKMEVVDPPPTHLLAIGCDQGLPAGGGTVRFQAGGKRIEVTTEMGQLPSAVAHALAGAVREQGLRATVVVNPRVNSAALPTVDLMVRDSSGQPVEVSSIDEETLSSDPTLAVCLGEVDLSDGLHHFTDANASAGTIEERSLVRALDDGDSQTIDVFIVPQFESAGRIGESFIFADGASIENTIILDRAGLGAGARASALAHELGHILMDMSGHPDDYGRDQPWMLMDADSADPTIFGPRRLSLDECERALQQSGPASPAPLLTPWPLYQPERASLPEKRRAQATQPEVPSARGAMALPTR